MDEQCLKKGKYAALEMEDRKDKANESGQEEAANVQIDVHDNLEEPFNADFWEKVCLYPFIGNSELFPMKSVQ